jgi:hypothetical protein
MKESKLTKMLAPLRTSMICGASVVSMAPPPAGCWSGVNELCELMVVRLLVRVAAALATAPRSTYYHRDLWSRPGRKMTHCRNSRFPPPPEFFLYHRHYCDAHHYWRVIKRNQATLTT